MFMSCYIVNILHVFATEIQLIRAVLCRVQYIVSIAEQLRELQIGFEYCREIVVLGGSTLQAREVLRSQLRIGSSTN